MKPYFEADAGGIYQGHAPEVLQGMEAESCHMVVTSPPYWGLRDYDLPPQIWGGDPACEHEWQKHLQAAANGIIHPAGMSGETLSGSSATRKPKVSAFCHSCNAWLGSFGLEPTPELYIEHTVEIFRGVWKVLRKDGTVWLNLGDSYAAGKRDYNSFRRDRGHVCVPRPKPPPGLKPKDLCGIPWRVALALQADGWWLRQDIIWSKPNPMPESVTDRCTKSHEYIFLLTKSAKYFYDAEAMKEPQEEYERNRRLREKSQGLNSTYSIAAEGKTGQSPQSGTGAVKNVQRRHELVEAGTRNKRSVWNVATHPFPEAHFATFPPKLIEPCVLAGTSEKGCCAECGAPWVRVVEPSKEHAKRIKTFRVMKFNGDEVGKYIQQGMDKRGLNQSQLSEYFPSHTGGKTGCVHNWVTGKNIPTAEQWGTIKNILSLGDRFDLLLENPATGELKGWDEQDDTLVRGLSGAGDTIPIAAKTIGWRSTCVCLGPPLGKQPVPCTVLDPFGGSMTTAIVAYKHGRKFVMIELSKTYIDDIGIPRIEKETQQLKLFN